MKKYEFTNDVRFMPNGVVLRRIRAVRDIGPSPSWRHVRAGALGGYIHSEENLSHEGDCWVDEGSMVYEDASVKEDAIVRGEAVVRGEAIISGRAVVTNFAYVLENARVCDSASITGHSIIYGRGYVGGKAWISDSVCIDGEACVMGDVGIRGHAYIKKGTIRDENQVLTVGGIGSRYDTTTFVCDNGKIYVKCGCFFGDICEFEDRVNKTHECEALYRTQYLNAIRFAKETFEENTRFLLKEAP